MFCSDATDPLLTDHITNLTNAVRQAKLLADNAPLSANFIRSTVVEFLRRHESIIDNDMARRLKLSAATQIVLKLAASATDATKSNSIVEASGEGAAVEAHAGDDDREMVRDILRGQQLKLFNILCDSRTKWTYFEALKSMRADNLWRNAPDSSDIEDDTVFEALKKLRSKMPVDCKYQLTIERATRRTRMEKHG